jgi:hypothetical protein
MDFDLKLFMFKYHTIFVFIIYSFIYLTESMFNINIFSNNWTPKLFGTLGGYLINDFFIKHYTNDYYFYFQNILKYFSIFLSQNIVSKFMIPNYIIFDFVNILKINFIIFIYFLFDVIIDVNVEDDNKNKEMYIDIIKASFGFYIVEKILKKELTYNHYIYIIIIIIAYYLFYTKLDSRIKELIKK